MSTEHAATRVLRFVPPVAALGTAFVLQTIACADLIGEVLSKQLGITGYVIATLFGVAVASGAEGGAAYLMDLYDKHLLARDSTWMLKLGMLTYVGMSAAAIHWWADHRQLPQLLSWLLAFMSASALFLWSRGSRWRNREAMRAAGQLDQALPRLATSAKALHPIRWIITMYLISWEPVDTTEQARERYAQWKARKHHRSIPVGVLTAQCTAHPEQGQLRSEHPAPSIPSTQRPAISGPAEHPTEQPRPAEQVSTEQTSTRTVTKQITEQIIEQTTRKASITELAQVLDEHFPTLVPGRPKALRALRGHFGSCSEPRALEAISLLTQWREAPTERVIA